MSFLDYVLLGAIALYCIWVIFFRKKKGCSGHCSGCSGCKHEQKDSD